MDAQEPTACNGYTAPVSEDLDKRSKFSLLVLLGVVLSVTLQLVTGFLLQVSPQPSLLSVHIAGGIIATALLLAEWVWLLLTHSGRRRLAGFLAPGAGPSGWSDALFLVAVTVTVVLGILLACILRGILRLPFGPLLDVHRAFAVAVAVLYLVHSVLAIRQRQNAKGP